MFSYRFRWMGREHTGDLWRWRHHEACLWRYRCWLRSWGRSADIVRTNPNGHTRTNGRSAKGQCLSRDIHPATGAEHQDGEDRSQNQERSVKDQVWRFHILMLKSFAKIKPIPVKITGNWLNASLYCPFARSLRAGPRQVQIARTPARVVFQFVMLFILPLGNCPDAGKGRYLPCIATTQCKRHV